MHPAETKSYRPISNLSTETAVLKVMADILFALDTGNLAVSTLQDLSAAFDSVDHDTLLRRLQTSYGLVGWSLLVRLLPDRPYTVRPVFGEQFYTVGGFVRSASLGVYTFRSSDRPVGPTGLSDWSVRRSYRVNASSDWFDRRSDV